MWAPRRPSCPPEWLARTPPGSSPSLTRARMSCGKSARLEVDDLGTPLFERAVEPALNGHPALESLDEPVGAFPGVPDGGDQEAAVSRPGDVVGLSLGQSG